MSLEPFARELFPEACRLPFSPLHRYLLERRAAKIALPLARRRGALDVVIAPRGAAKSTLVSLIFPLHALLYGHERYIVLISATLRQAARRIANMRAMLTEGGALHRLYAPTNARDRRRWLRRASDRTLELGPARIEAFGAGAELRGISHGAWRPTWIILDDVERGDRVRRRLHRDALADWFAEVVDNLGDGCTHIDIIGTLLHPDALPARLERRPDAIARRFASIVREADDAALWAAWRGQFHDLTDPARLETARAFFNERRAAMLAGADVLWPEKEDYYALQVMRETRGRIAFNKEKQNDPAEAEAGLFARARLGWFRIDGARIVRGDAVNRPTTSSPLGELRRFGFLDPSLGRDGGDFAAIATIGLDADGRLYVLDVWLAHAAPSEQIRRLFDLHAEWGYEAFGIETNAFQRVLLEPLEGERERRRRDGQPWDVPIAERRHRGAKSERITALEPLVASGQLLFNEALGAVLLAQFEEFPLGTHDDGPDAVAAAVELAQRALPPGPPQRRARRMHTGGTAGMY